MRPIVSVIIPAYNVENTISYCLDSVCNQTLKDIEIIVINDGSTDSTSEILDEYQKKDDRIRVYHINNSGQGCARNIGIKNANGEYIGFVDADDFIHADMYNKLVKLITLNNAQMAQCNMNRIDISGNIIGSNILKIKNETVEIDNDVSEYFKKYFKNRRHSYECCNKLFKKDFIIENGIYFYDNSMVFAEDLLFNLEVILYIKKIVFLNEGLYNYVYNPSSHFQTVRLDRTDKICNLFNIFINKVKKKYNSNYLINEISKFAILHIILYATQVLYEKGGEVKVKQLIKRDDVNEYLEYGLKNPDNIIDGALFLSLKYFPCYFKYKIMKLYCRYKYK